VYSSGTVALETNPDELGLDPGDSADLYIEAEEPDISLILIQSQRELSK